jgi:hypothetical protein
MVVPLSVFSNRKVGPLEALSAYLHDEMKLKFSDIAKILKRDQRTIWTSYHNAKRKA